jgi:hypothetical protein
MVRNTTPTDGSATGTFRLVNRYSGLVLAMSNDTARAVETTPARSWADGHSGTGTPRTPADQTLELTPVG